MKITIKYRKRCNIAEEVEGRKIKSMRRIVNKTNNL